MDLMKVKITRVSNTKAVPEIPRYATAGSAGVDLYACIEEDITIQPGAKGKVPTGIAIELSNPQVAAFVFARSGLAAKYGIALTNGVGVIDSDYRGEIQVLLINQGKEPFVIHHGDRIAQMVFMPVFQVQFEELENLSDTDRGIGGFGSTGT